MNMTFCCIPRESSSILERPQSFSAVLSSNRYFEVELAPGADPQALLQRVVNAGAAVNRFEIVQPSLHQIFLEKVGAKARGPEEAEGVEMGMTGHG